MNAQIGAVLCGIGGFGHWYLEHFLDRPDSPIAFKGFVDPAPERSMFLGRIREAGLPVFPSLEEFYEQSDAELAILASPIQFHCPQTLVALSKGSHVLCEKPLCGSVVEARSMCDAARSSGRVVAIGYQDSFLESTQRLKADILAGVWGRPLVFKCAALWPRSREYYGRSGWAGRLRDGQGRAVFDSPVNNAAAHFLHHMLYLLGDSVGTSAVPAEVEAQLYRAREIENYDTAFLRCRTTGGAEVFFAVTHAVGRERGPIFELAFEKGAVRYELPGGEIAGEHADGRRRSYGPAERSGRAKVLDTVAAIREGRAPLCGVEAAMSHTLAVAAAQESGRPVADFPRELVSEFEKKGEHWLQVEGLDEVVLESLRSGRLPGPGEAPWVRSARAVSVG